jgi:hypothetical protein
MFLGAFDDIAGLDDLKIPIFFLIIVLGPCLTYLVTSVRSSRTIKATSISEPPLVPYWIPFIGNLPSFLLDTPAFAKSIQYVITFFRQSHAPSL